MRLNVIACNVFMREVCQAVAESPQVIDLEFTCLLYTSDAADE